jgi:hypothetical protein
LISIRSVIGLRDVVPLGKRFTFFLVPGGDSSNYNVRMTRCGKNESLRCNIGGAQNAESEGMSILRHAVWVIGLDIWFGGISKQ